MYSVTDVATALTDLARGTTYTEAARRIQVNHNWQDFDGTDEAPEPRSLDGRTVACGLTVSAPSLVEAPQVLLDGSRVYSLRKHPVPARSSG